MSFLKMCYKHDLISPPKFVTEQLQYEVIMGSTAYAVNTNNSDLDIYGFCIPNRNIVFPHENPNYIHNFDKIPSEFKNYQEHHIKSKDGRKELDFDIYNIVRYFFLCSEGNPNMIDSLFVPRRCVTHITQIGELVRENRKLFLSKKCWHTFKGYAFSQMYKMEIKNPDKSSKRYDSIMKYGFDIKFGYHLVRLMCEIEQILTECDLDLEKNRKQLKAIRDGLWTKKQIKEFFYDKERDLEKVYIESELPHKPRKDEIRNLLYECLRMHFNDNKIQNKNDEYYKKGLIEIQNKIENILKE